MLPASSDPPRHGQVRRESLVVGVLVLAGAVLRLWGLKALGFSHFDEGIYATAGLYALAPAGLASLDPTLIPYAPAGFPVLVGVSYLLFGVSDVAAILVSIAAGALLVPAAAWLAGRTFGAGAGAAAAGLVAFSGYHVAFSRMALADALFLLAFVLALICGQRFLERPRLDRAILLGLSVALCQWVKYNGWLAGLLVMVSAALGIALDPAERRGTRIRAVWGYGLVAVAVALAAYWPWFAFVEAHGGYAGLIRHHRGYLSGPECWLPYLRVQLRQAAALSGGPPWNLVEYLSAVAGCAVVQYPRLRAGVPRSCLLLVLLAPVVVFIPFLYWPMAAGCLLDGRVWRHPSQRLLAVGWVGLSILTPFYHPYARLWLPVHFLSWMLITNSVRNVLLCNQEARGRLTGAWDRENRYGLNLREWFACGLVLLCIELLGPELFRAPTLGPRELPGPLAASDSLRIAVRHGLSDLPEAAAGLRLLARPPVRFYLAGRVPVIVEPDLAHLRLPGNPRFWALVDQAQLRQEGDLNGATDALLEHWEVVREYPSRLSLPALLDTDPDAARAGRSSAVYAPLWLMRPRMGGPAR